MVREISKTRYIVAFLITAGIFLLGLLLGAVLTQSKFNELKDLQQDLRTQLSSYETQALLASQNPCKLENADSLTEELGSLANRLTAMEEQLGKNDPEVTKLKEYYSLLEIRHWLFLRKINQECSSSYKLILFFYSSDDTQCPSCQSQGYILTYLRSKYPNVRVYSFDITLQDPALDSLKKLYDIKETPSLVVNETPYLRYLSKEELEQILIQPKTTYSSL